ncbi:MAG: hypothetical protein ACKO38_02660, partial [Planctomycetota bacterium]
VCSSDLLRARAMFPTQAMFPIQAMFLRILRPPPPVLTRTFSLVRQWKALVSLVAERRSLALETRVTGRRLENRRRCLLSLYPAEGHPPAR